MSFDNIIGHKSEIKFLKDSIDSNNISHSYLFLGNSGIGKCKIAFEFSKILLDTYDLEICPDFKYIKKEEDKKSIAVKVIRDEIINDVYEKPVVSNKKIYIIDDVETLNKESQNSLLKTLEEPPEYVVIILIASNISNILSTILSRVTKINFINLNFDELKEYVLNNKYNVSDDIIEFCNGSIGMLNNIIDSNYLDKFKYVNNIYDNIINKDYVSSVLFLENIKLNEKYLLDYLQFLMYKKHNTLAVMIIEEAKYNLKNNGNYDITINNMILKLIESEG